MRRPDLARLILFGGAFWLVVLGCRTSDVVARVNPTATSTVTRTVQRPTFTPAPPTQPPTVIPPTLPPPPSPTRTPTTRPAPTRIPTPARAPTPAPPPPTPDPYAGWYYRPVNKGCVAAPNTRIEGTVIENGVPKNGVRVRVSHAEHAEPSINDFITGTDPTDYKHINPALQGKYRLGIAEGQRIDGNWWVFVLDAGGNPLSPGVHVKTHDDPGCNTATVDFVH